MQVRPDCIPCYLKQVLSAARAVTDSPEALTEALTAASRLIDKLPLQATPAENSTILLKAAQEVLGVEDPFADKKRQVNQEVLNLLPEFEERVRSGKDPLWTALLYSVAGNIIDMGILPEYDLSQSIEQVFQVEMAINDYPEFHSRLEKAKKIVFLADNAGEIVLDILLISQIGKFAPVTCIVKGGPILNDATISDAEQVGMGSFAQVLANGSNFLGTPLEHISKETKSHLAEADLIISKGQANFETLDSFPAPVFFILRAKCSCVADELGVQIRDVVLKKSDAFKERARF